MLPAIVHCICEPPGQLKSQCSHYPLIILTGALYWLIDIAGEQPAARDQHCCCTAAAAQVLVSSATAAATATAWATPRTYCRSSKRNYNAASIAQLLSINMINSAKCPAL